MTKTQRLAQPIPMTMRPKKRIVLKPGRGNRPDADETDMTVYIPRSIWKLFMTRGARGSGTRSDY